MERILAATTASGVADLSHMDLGPAFHLEDWRRWLNFKGTLRANLRTLLLDGNNLQILSPALGELNSLSELSVVANKLTSLGDQVTLLRSLSTLRLSDNNLKGFPEWEGRGMPSLRVLHIDQNPRIQLVPTWLPVECPRLVEVNLGYCNLAAFPMALVRLTGLKILRLSGNKGLVLPKTFCGPDALAFVSSLEELYLSDIGLRDASLQCLRELAALRCLDLARNLLVVLPRFIVDMENLRSLYVRLTSCFPLKKTRQ